MPKRTKSFKYCSLRKKGSCMKASKRCSYRKNRTPRCQPRSKKATRKSNRKSKRKTASKRKKSRRVPTKRRNNPLTGALKTPRAIACARKSSKKSCGKLPNSCHWDPRKNVCRSRRFSIFDKTIKFEDASADVAFAYPITREGLQHGIFAPLIENGKTLLYLVCDENFYESLQSKYEEKMRKWWCWRGKRKAEARGTPQGSAIYKRIGRPLQLTDEEYSVVYGLLPLNEQGYRYVADNNDYIPQYDANDVPYDAPHVLGDLYDPMPVRPGSGAAAPAPAPAPAARAAPAPRVAALAGAPRAARPARGAVNMDGNRPNVQTRRAAAAAP